MPSDRPPAGVEEATARSASPRGVPPGSWVTTARDPRSASQARRTLQVGGLAAAVEPLEGDEPRARRVGHGSETIARGLRAAPAPATKPWLSATLQHVRFVWDEAKRSANLRAHGLDFIDAREVFRGPVLERIDTRLDYGEERLIGTGFLRDLVVVLVYSEPEQETIRVISLRKALSHERERFETHLANRLG